MYNILFTVHILLALAVIGLVLVQNSQGGGLGIGGGQDKQGPRAGIDGVGKTTWFLGAAFITSALVLTIVTAQNSGSSSILDQLRNNASSSETTTSDAIEVPVLEETAPSGNETPNPQ